MPTGTFLYSTDRGTAPLTVGFLLREVPVNSLKVWHFIDSKGNDSSDGNHPVCDLVVNYTFSRADVYQVYVGYVSWQNGKYVEYDKSPAITINVSPTPPFQIIDKNPLQWQGVIMEGSSVAILLSSKVGGDDGSLLVNWHWGDNTIDTQTRDLQSPNHIYGISKICQGHLTIDEVTGSGVPPQDQWNFYVLVLSPAEFYKDGYYSVKMENLDRPGYEPYCWPGDRMQFSIEDVGSIPVKLPPVDPTQGMEFLWNLGDGATAKGPQSGPCMYSNPGPYNVTCTVRNGDLDLITISASITVLPNPFVFSIPTSVPSGQNAVISVTGRGFLPDRDVSIELYDNNGNLVGNDVRTADSAGVFTDDQFQLAALPSGNYKMTAYVTLNNAIRTEAPFQIT